jgi:L-fucose mutarotase
MINGRIIHPRIIAALAAAGHRSTVLITDAHFAASTAVGSNATLVHLNLEAGSPTVPHVVELVAATIPIEKCTSMHNPEPDFGGVQAEIATILGPAVPHSELSREDFYTASRSEDLALCIITGDIRRFGNVLLTVGVNPRE